MSKNKKPSNYIALNRHAKKMFKKAGILYHTPESLEAFKTLIELSKKKKK